MNITWKPQDDGMESARVLPNPCGLMLEVCPLLGGGVEWIVWATTPDNCEDIGRGQRPSVIDAKHAAEVVADVILMNLRTAIDAAMPLRPCAPGQ